MIQFGRTRYAGEQIIWTTAFALALLAPVSAVAQDRAQAAENFRQADMNGDEALNADEFAVFIDMSAADGIANAKRISSLGLQARAFARVDANGDGLVTPGELQATQ